METKRLSQDQVDESKVILDHVIDGTVGINSPDLFVQLIDQYPQEPLLHRYYADLQLKNGLNQDAAKSYNQAAKLFIAAGMMLPAIVAKISQWRIEAPSNRKVQVFISDLKNGNFKETRLNSFFKGLSAQEAISLFPSFEMAQFPPGHEIKSPGDEQNELFLVVSGRIRDSIYLTLENTGKVFRKPTKVLSEGDFFGDIYPFDEEKKSHSYIETIRHTEVVRISMPKLTTICRNDTGIELGIIDLLRIRSQDPDHGLDHKTRNAPRYHVPKQMNVEIYPEESNNRPVCLTGYSRDISIGGMGIVLDPQTVIGPQNSLSFGKTLIETKTKISFVVETVSIHITGKVLWCREVLHDGQKTLAIGVQYDQISPKIADILVSLYNISEPVKLSPN